MFEHAANRLQEGAGGGRRAGRGRCGRPLFSARTTDYWNPSHIHRKREARATTFRPSHFRNRHFLTYTPSRLPLRIHCEHPFAKFASTERHHQISRWRHQQLGYPTSRVTVSRALHGIRSRSRWSGVRGVSKLARAVRGRFTHLTSGLFERRSDTHCAPPALGAKPRARPTIFGAKNPGFRSHGDRDRNTAISTRHARTRPWSTHYATSAAQATCGYLLN